jgi:hypothetical protein
MYIYYGLTPAGKTSNRWGSPEAKFILEVTKARDALQKKGTTYKGGTNHLSRCTVSILPKCPFSFMQF